MGEATNSLKDFSKNFHKSLNQLEKSVASQPRSKEIKEIMDLGSSLNETLVSQADETAIIDPATLYDSVSTINKLSNTAIVSYEVSASFTDISMEKTQTQIKELKEIQMNTNGALESIGKLITPENANERLLSYSEGFSDLSVIIASMKDLCTELNKLDLAKTQDEIKNEFSIAKNRGIIDGLINFIGTKINSLAARLKPVLGSIIDKLKDAFNKLKENPWVKKVIEVISKVINTIKLKMINKHFSFVDDVVKLAKKYNWNFQSITVQLPDIGLGMVEFAGTKIPFPNVTEPIVSVTFVP